MNLTILSDDLAKSLSKIGHAVESRPTLPVLSHVLLDANAEKDLLTFSGTNLEQFIVLRAIANVDEVGRITVPWRLFNDLAKTLKGNVKVELSTDESDLFVKCGKTEATLRGIPAEEFPLPPAVLENGTTLAIFEPDDLHERLQQVTFATADDESRPVLTGVYVEGKEGVLSFVTADGFRMAWRKGESYLDDSFIMPGQAADTLVKMLPDETEQISLFVDEHHRSVCWRLNTADIVTQLIEGNFVNYRQIVPEPGETQVVVDAMDLAKLLKRADLFVRQHHTVNIEARPIGDKEAHLYVSTQGDVETGAFEAHLPIEMIGEPVTFAINTRFMTDALKACGTRQVTISIVNETRPILVKPVGDDSYLCVVTPMFLRE